MKGSKHTRRNSQKRLSVASSASASGQACSLLLGTWKMLIRHLSTADSNLWRLFLLSTMRTTAATYWPVCHAHLRLRSTWKPWVCFSVTLKLAALRKGSCAAFCLLPPRNQKHWDFTSTQEWIIIEDILNFFFSPTCSIWRWCDCCSCVCCCCCRPPLVRSHVWETFRWQTNQCRC